MSARLDYAVGGEAGYTGGSSVNQADPSIAGTFSRILNAWADVELEGRRSRVVQPAIPAYAYTTTKGGPGLAGSMGGIPPAVLIGGGLLLVLLLVKR